MEKIKDWMKQNILKVMMALVIIATITGVVFLVIHSRNLLDANRQQLIDANNRIAEMSQTIQENETTWSRFAQQRDDQISQLEDGNHELADLISSRNEQILSLTQVVAQLRSAHIVVDHDHGTVSQTTEQSQEDPTVTRQRVDFDETYHEHMRVRGYTLTDPAYADLTVDFQPVDLVVTTTQDEQGEWRTYVSSDWEDLQFGHIESSVNPRVATQGPTAEQQRGWEDGIEVGLIGGVSTAGNSGMLGLTAGYDFGPASIGILGTGVVTPNGGDVIVGLYGNLNPFAL